MCGKPTTGCSGDNSSSTSTFSNSDQTLPRTSNRPLHRRYFLSLPLSFSLSISLPLSAKTNKPQQLEPLALPDCSFRNCTDAPDKTSSYGSWQSFQCSGTAHSRIRFSVDADRQPGAGMDLHVLKTLLCLPRTTSSLSRKRATVNENNTLLLPAAFKMVVRKMVNQARRLWLSFRIQLDESCPAEV